MIKIENVDIYGWEATIRGMRNPKNSWDKSDSYFGYDCNSCGKIEKEGFCEPKKHNCSEYYGIEIGPNDLNLMKTLSNAGTDHGKFLRMITVTMDITAPLYWWKQMDQYRIGVTTNSCSTMHKIHSKEFTIDDFSHEHLTTYSHDGELCRDFLGTLEDLVDELNIARELFLETKDKVYWWQMIQLLPTSYNQKRTVQVNYQVLKAMYNARKNHKLDEWHAFCDWCLTLPYFKDLCVME